MRPPRPPTAPVLGAPVLAAPVLAALAVDAACGVLAAAVANGLGPRPSIEAFFIGCALAAALGHALLTPGCLWVAGSLASRTLMGALLMRTVVAGIALSCAPVVVIAVMEIPLHVAGKASNLDLSALALTASGVVAGLGSVAAQWLDRRPGLSRPPGWTHMAGAVAGLWLVVGGTVLSSQIHDMPWTRALLALATVMVAGLPHTLLAAQAAARAGHAFPASAAMKRRAAWCGAALVMAALGVAASAAATA